MMNLHRVLPVITSTPPQRGQWHAMGQTVCALTALALAQFSWSAEAREQVTHTVIAATGTAAPSGGNFLFFFSTPAVNARGQVAFDAFLGGPSHSGVFVTDRTGVSPTALGGDPDPASGNFPFVSTPALTERGDVIFQTDTGIFRSNGRSITPLVQNGDPAPEAGRQDGIGVYAANSQGAIAYRASVTDGLGTEGIFRNDGHRTVAIALDTTVPPTGGHFFLLGDPQIDERGRVAFFAGMEDGAADFAILRGDGQRLAPVFAAGQPAPGGGTFQDFGQPKINKRGQVLSLAALENATGPIGLFLGDTREAVAIAVSGQVAPSGGSYCRPTDAGCPHAVQFPGRTILNDRGQAAFTVFLTGGGSRSGIFRGDGRTTTTIALEGMAAPGTTGVFDSFEDMTMGDNGRVAFIATLTQGVGGVDTSNNRGIWVGTSPADLHLVARSGQIIAGQTLIAPVVLAPLENRTAVVWRARLSSATAIISSVAECDADHQGTLLP